MLPRRSAIEGKRPKREEIEAYRYYVTIKPQRYCRLPIEDPRFYHGA